MGKTPFSHFRIIVYNYTYHLCFVKGHLYACCGLSVFSVNTFPFFQKCKKEPGISPALRSDIFQFFQAADEPKGHLLVGLENFRIFVLPGKPGYTDKLIGQDNVGDRLALLNRELYHTVIAPEDIPANLQPFFIILSKGLRQHRSGCVTGIIDPGIPLRQFEIDDAPLLLAANDVSGIGIPSFLTRSYHTDR